MLSFYMLLNDLYNKEVIFLQKLMLIVYSNLFSYIELLISFVDNNLKENETIEHFIK